MSLDRGTLNRTLIYEAAAPAPVHLAAVSELRVVDAEAEKLQKKWSSRGLMAVVAAVVCIIALAFVPAAAGAGLLAAIIAVIAFFMRAHRVGRCNFENRRYELLGQVLRLIGKDMAADAPVKVRLDLRPGNDKTKLKSRTKVPRGMASLFVDPWLVLSGRFLDGTSFDLALTEKRMERMRHKRSHSGRTKTKIKTKGSLLCALDLKVKPARYPLLAAVGPSAQGAIRLPPYASLKALKLTADSLSLDAVAGGEWQAMSPEQEGKSGSGPDATRLLAMMFMGLYQVLGRSRKPGPGRASAAHV